ncbi:hypothetical protein ECZC06_53940 [Escherichia coli]|nr:hypothetical protein ECZC06_53940 [Escherichia coli]
MPVNTKKRLSDLCARREDGLRELERKALQVGNDEDGGYAIPEELDRTILTLLKDEVVMRQEATVITLGGSDYKKLVNLGGTTSGWVGKRMLVRKPPPQNWV